jgi:leader peptidase (prepilin peptidase)/N-methyltransferase
MTIASVILAGAAGATVGSFVGTAILRTAHKEQVVFGRSHCDGCGRDLSALELTPIVSFLVLRGRCRRCGSRIAPMHFLAECVGLLAAVSLFH